MYVKYIGRTLVITVYTHMFVHVTWRCLILLLRLTYFDTYLGSAGYYGRGWKSWSGNWATLDITVYPKKYAHGFCFAVLCCGYTLTDFPISIRLTSLALWQSNDCPSASKATLMNMDKYFMWIHYERLHNHNKAKHNKTVCIFLGIYCAAKAYMLSHAMLAFTSEACIHDYVIWQLLFIPKIKRLLRWSWEWMSNYISHFKNVCSYLSMLVLKLINVSKMFPRIVQVGLVVVVRLAGHNWRWHCTSFYPSHLFAQQL